MDDGYWIPSQSSVECSLGTSFNVTSRPRLLDQGLKMKISIICTCKMFHLLVYKFSKPRPRFELLLQFLLYFITDEKLASVLCQVFETS